MKTCHHNVFIQIFLHIFFFTTLFKLVASSFYKKVADFYEQSNRRVSSAVGAY